MDIEEKTILVEGVTVHYLQAGESGSPVVLLHGAGADSARLSWEEVIVPLAESGHTVYALDLPGYGATGWVDASYTVQYNVDFVLRWLNAVGLDQVGLMGLSMGGAISLGLALDHPDRVEKLVLVDSYGIQRKVAMHFISWLMVKIPGIMEYSWSYARKSKQNSRWLLSSIFANPKAIPDSLMDEVYQAALQPHAGEAFTRQQRDEVTPGGLKTVFISRLPEIQIPTLLIHGRKDIAVPLACAEEAHHLIAGSELRIIDNAGHWPQREQPAAFLQALLPFFI
jgi:pimeloyl-ACP methyl ester carboxylesterase